MSSLSGRPRIVYRPAHRLWNCARPCLRQRQARRAGRQPARFAANAFGATAHGSVLLAAVDARMNEVYCAVYRRDEHVSEAEPHARAAACARTDRR